MDVTVISSNDDQNEEGEETSRNLFDYEPLSHLGPSDSQSDVQPNDQQEDTRTHDMQRDSPLHNFQDRFRLHDISDSLDQYNPEGSFQFNSAYSAPPQKNPQARLGAMQDIQYHFVTYPECGNNSLDTLVQRWPMRCLPLDILEMDTEDDDITTVDLTPASPLSAIADIDESITNYPPAAIRDPSIYSNPT